MVVQQWDLCPRIAKFLATSREAHPPVRLNYTHFKEWSAHDLVSDGHHHSSCVLGKNISDSGLSLIGSFFVDRGRLGDFSRP